jgi:type IV secretion system protein TrbL
VTPDVGILTSLFNSFTTAFANGIGFIHSDAKWLLGVLILIDLILAVVLNLSDGDHMKTLITRILKYGFFIWLVMDYKNLVNVVIDSFEKIGLKAGGGGLSNALLADPSALADEGILLTSPIFDHINNVSAIDVIKNLPDIIFTGLMALLIIFCFFIIGIQIFITYLEFYVVGALALILLPFGVNKHTAFLGEKAIGAVLSFGIKLMVLAFIAAVAIPLVKTWALPVDPTLKQCLCLFLGACALMFLSWHAPTMAAGLLSGHPTLTAGTAAGMAVAGGFATYAGGWAAVTAGRASIEAGHRATMAAVRGGGQLAGAYESGGIGEVAKLGGAYVSKGAHKVTDSFVSSFDSGKKTAASMLDDSGEGNITGGSGTTPSGGGSDDPFAHMDFAKIRRRLKYVHNSIPPSETRGGGGSAKPDLKGGDKS